ncbi:MAG: FKBP-type peptidyl-prolyl cis-trans isomerase [Gammaproteobacteria bacterium]|jgi:FKBP-type peptidyl-prolyl cis-trans isomerase|nr:FKBP-type peptidyl-prolyl cis-trans isomerase [Gammaproteobacteria bacterium]NBX40391.1 FKBP-type peptidyl-prolyl cis-trans isomerase [Gammaproteobacteria bacterium]
MFARQWAEAARRNAATSAPVAVTQNSNTPAGANVNESLITELSDGAGAAVANGQTAVVHYTGWLYDAAAAENKGRKFDSSHDHGEPFAFEVGAGEVIRGWDLGVAGMKVGGRRRLVVPAELGYGARGAGGVIPGGATLVFDVELVAIQ